MNANQLGRISCGWIGVTLIAAACGGRLNDVGDVHGNEAGAGDEGGTNAVTGQAGSSPKPQGGNGSAGKSPMTAPEGGSGTAGSENAEAGTAGATLHACDNPRIVELFEFDEPNVLSGVNTGPKEQWSRSPYDSTNTQTGAIDHTASPPSNSNNLANRSLLVVDAQRGDPAPAMQYAIPFSPSPPAGEVVNLVYAFASYAQLASAVDLSHAQLKASAMLLRAPNANCDVFVTPWTTGTTTGTDFIHVDGSKFALKEGQWVTIHMDLGKSTPSTSVNQLGFALRSSCTQPADGGVGGAGGAGGAGNDGGSTIVLFDNIETLCE